MLTRRACWKTARGRLRSEWSEKPRLYSSQSSEPQKSDPEPTSEREIPPEKAGSEAWTQVLSLGQPEAEGLYSLRKYVEDKSLKARIANESRRKTSPLYALADLVKTGGKTPKQQPLERSTEDKIMEIQKWSQLHEDLELEVTGVENLKHGDELVIVGGGISGMSLAWFVAHSRPDVKITILEASSRLGGYMESETIGNAERSSVLEKGPRTLLPSHPGTVIATQILRDVGLLDSVVGVLKSSPTNTKALVYNSKLTELPSNMGDAVKFLFSPIMSGIKRAPLLDLWRRPRPKRVHDESVDSFISRRFNKLFSDRFFSAILRGIYAGDVTKLSARSVTRFNKLYLSERINGSSIVGAGISGAASSLDSYVTTAMPLLAQAMTGNTYKNHNKLSKSFSLVGLRSGIQSLPDAMETALKQNFGKQINIVRDCQVTGITASHNNCVLQTSKGEVKGSVVVSTLSAKQVAPLLQSKDATQAAGLASKVEFASLAVVNIHFPNKPVPKDMFGFLIPRSENAQNTENVLGVIFDSSVQNAAIPVAPHITGKSGSVAPKGQSRAKEVRPEPQIDKKAGSGNLSLDRVSSFLRDQFDDGPVADAQPAGTAQSKHSTYTVMIGGDMWSGKNPRDLVGREQQVIESAIKALQKYLDLGPVSSSDYVARVKWQMDSIPQYTVGHSDRVSDIQETVSRAYFNRLLLSGTSFGRGVGVGDCIVDSLTVASRFSQQRKLLYPQFYLNHFRSFVRPGRYA